MSRILVFGGHGRIALLLEPILKARGDEITAVIRNADHVAEVEAAGATALVADVEQMDVDALAEVIQGHDAIVWSAGAGGGDPKRTYAVDRDAAIRSMIAAAQVGVRRYVMVSWRGSVEDHGISPSDSFHPYADAKWTADAHLRETDLKWTILGPGALTSDEPTGRIRIDAASPASVSRADVAAVIVAVLDDPGTIGRTIRFGNGTPDRSEPIAEALHG